MNCHIASFPLVFVLIGSIARARQQEGELIIPEGDDYAISLS